MKAMRSFLSSVALLAVILAIPAGAHASTGPSIAADAATLSTQTINQWAGHREAGGRYSDPFKKTDGGYGQTMLGLASMRQGYATANPVLIDSGIQTVTGQLSTSKPGSFDILAGARAYNWASTHLAGYPPFVAVQAQWQQRLLALPLTPTSGDRAAACTNDPKCYNNLKLVTAVGDLELIKSGLSGGAGRLSNPGALKARALAVLTKAVPANNGSKAYRTGTMKFTNAGINSDPDTNPLAYHILSTMMLGQAVELLGGETPAVTMQAFQRSARGMAGAIAPDGDLTYIGRGQGNVWVSAAAVDAAAMAARYSNDTVWRSRYLTIAELSLTRLRQQHAPTGWGLALVPRLSGSWGIQPRDKFGKASNYIDYIGIDHYADTTMYNGFALWSLDHARPVLQDLNLSPTVVPSATPGAFIEPDKTRFATVTRGNSWFAIHSLTSHGTDARYAYGLSAAKKRVNGVWKDAIEQRPMTDGKATDAGITTSRSGRRLIPIVKNVRFVNGKLVGNGGWGNNYKASNLLDKSSFVWTFADKSAELEFKPQEGRTFHVEVWYPASASVKTSSNGACADGVCWKFNRPVSIKRESNFASGYERNLKSLTFTFKAPASKAKAITYKTSWR